MPRNFQQFFARQEKSAIVALIIFVGTVFASIVWKMLRKASNKSEKEIKSDSMRGIVSLSITLYLPLTSTWIVWFLWVHLSVSVLSSWLLFTYDFTWIWLNTTMFRGYLFFSFFPCLPSCILSGKAKEQSNPILSKSPESQPAARDHAGVSPARR